MDRFLTSNNRNGQKNLDRNSIYSETTSANFEDNPPSLINKDMKEWFKTFFTFYHMEKDLKAKIEKDDGIVIQCCSSTNVNHSAYSENNIVEVLVEPINLNEFSIILPECHMDPGKVEKKPFIGKKDDAHLSALKKEMPVKSSLSNLNYQTSSIANRQKYLESSFNLFPNKLQCKKDTPVLLQKNCDCLNKTGSFCKSHHHSIEKIEMTNGDWKKKAVLESFKKPAIKINEDYLKNLHRIPNYSNERHIDIYNKTKGSCVFQRQLSQIKANYANENNNNRNNGRRTARSTTDIGCTFNNPESFQNMFGNRLHDNNHTSPGQITIHNNNLKCNDIEKNRNNRIPCDTEGRNPNDVHLNHTNQCWPHQTDNSCNCCNPNQRDVLRGSCCEYCAQYGDPRYNSCYNMCPGSMPNPCSPPLCCPQTNPVTPCCNGPNKYNHCPDMPVPCHTRQPTNCPCCESQACCANDQLNNISKNPDESCQKMHCESSGSQECSDTEDCCCRCPCRCSQFPKPPPYCLNTTYRMNYFQKCIPKFRRYRECDNLRLPLC